MGLAVCLATIFVQPTLAQDSTNTQPTKPKRGLFGQILDQVITTTTSGGGLSSGDIAMGLREALSKGISKGSDQASAVNGYYKNPLLRIAFPPRSSET